MVIRKKKAVPPVRSDLPVYPIGVAAKLLGVHPRTLRIYESEGLLEPDHRGARRLYSPDHIRWVGCLRSMIHEQGISIPGIKKLLALVPCWQIGECGIHETCGARVDRSAPRNGVAEGDEEQRAKRSAQKSLQQGKCRVE